MQKLWSWTLVFSMAALAWGATPPKKPTGKSSVRNGKKVSGTTWRNRQMVPTADRYKEIQEALVAKGYLGQENATGSWNQASVDALKRFQAEQNIESTGKINSLSLIALGLGPKRDAPAPPADSAAAKNL